MNDFDRDAIRAGYPNAATARLAERRRVERERQAEAARRAAAIRAPRERRSGGEAAAIVFSFVPELPR